MNIPVAVMCKVYVVWGPLLVTLLWTLSCGSTPALLPTSAPTPTPSPREVLGKSSDRMVALNTARFTLEHEGGGSAQLFPGLVLQRVEGRVAMPDSFAVSVEAISSFPRSFVPIDVVVQRDQAFITDFIRRGKWNPIPVENLPFNFADLGRTLSDIILSLQGPSLAGTEVVDGVSSWRINGIVASENLATLIPKAGKGYEVGLELWIGQAEGLLRKVKIKGQVLSTDRPDVVRVLSIYDFDKPVEISLPAVSD